MSLLELPWGRVHQARLWNSRFKIPHRGGSWESETQVACAAAVREGRGCGGVRTRQALDKGILQAFTLSENEGFAFVRIIYKILSQQNLGIIIVMLYMISYT